MSRSHERVFIAAYWVGPPFSLDECARRLHDCLSDLAAISPVFGAWYPKGQNVSEPYLTDSASLAALLDSGQQEENGVLFPELGSRWTAWNGDTEVGVSVSATCAASSLLNNFNLDLPSISTSGRELYGKLESVFSSVVRSWKPDWAVATSVALCAEANLNWPEPLVGWLTYSGSRRPAVSERPIGDGFILSAAEEWLRVDSRHVAELAAKARSAGVLSPLVDSV